jgi:predicted lipoprotein
MSNLSGRIKSNAPVKVPALSARHARLSQWALLITLLLLVQVVAACSLYTVRPIKSATSSNQANQFDQQFDPTSYANANWSSKVVPTIMKKAVDLSTVLTALQKDSDAAQKQYATQSSDGFYNFMVKGQAKVVAVNTSSRNGTLSIQLPTNQQQPTILLQIGPVVLGTALRDSVGFINYNQFTNQVQYAQVADALNAHAVQDLKGTDFASLKGKTITFYGAFTYATLQQITIAPVKITPEGAGA